MMCLFWQAFKKTWEGFIFQKNCIVLLFHFWGPDVFYSFTVQLLHHLNLVLIASVQYSVPGTPRVLPSVQEPSPGEKHNYLFNPFTATCTQGQIWTKFPNFINWNCEKQIASYETGRELSFDSKVRVTLQNSIKHSGSKRVKYSSHVNIHRLFPELSENNKSVITEMRRIPIGVLG